MRLALGLLLSTIGATVLTFGSIPSATADEITSEHSSSSSSTTLVGEKKGYAFKYGERLRNWASQIDTGIAKGWLTADEASQFKSRLDTLRQLHDSVSANGYAKPELDNMEKQFNQFNIDLSNAAGKPKTATSTGTKEVTTTKAVKSTKPAHVKTKTTTKTHN